MAPRVKFNYLKGSAFRTVHVDGVFGGVAPSGFLNMSVFTERHAIPQAQTFELKEDGNLGNEIAEDRIGREGFTRELEVNLVMSVEMVKKLHGWLGEQLTKLEGVAPKRSAS
jgi:hypothetical protein